MNATTVLPFAPRHTTTDLGDTLRITLPSRKRWQAIIPASLAVIVWAAVVTGVVVFGGFALIRVVMARPETLTDSIFPIGFGLVWLGFFAVGGLTALYTLLWNLAGREVMEVSRRSIRLARRVPGWGRAQEYLTEHIQDLRVSPQAMPEWYMRSGTWPFATPGQLAFDYGARTIRFIDADEAEAKMILAEIQQRFPRYRPQAGEH